MASFDEALPGNSTTGKKIFRSDCSQCHGGIGISRSFNQGPNLNGLFGRQSGTTPVECMYSVAIIDKAVNLEEKTLYDYLLKPREYIPETKMFFPGLKKPQERADLIAYLKD